MGLPEVHIHGRRMTKYDPKIAMDIVERIADGELLIEITSPRAEPLTVTRGTFLRWVSTVPELRDAYNAALKLSASAFEEEAIVYSKNVANAPGSPARVSAANLLVGQYRWSAARRDPTRFGDKSSTAVVVPVSINTTLDLGSSPAGKDAELPDIYSFEVEKAEATDAEFTEVEETKAEPQALPQAQNTTPTTGSVVPQSRPDFRAILRVDEPVESTERQPMLAAQQGKPGRKPGPQKRVLKPRISREKK